MIKKPPPGAEVRTHLEDDASLPLARRLKRLALHERICRQPTPEAAEPVAMRCTNGAVDEVHLLPLKGPHATDERMRETGWTLTPLFAHPPKPEATEAVENLDHILDAEHSARILGFPIMACWCCGKPAEVSMADTCARCTDDLCWAHSSWIPVMAWNKRYSAPKVPEGGK